MESCGITSGAELRARSLRLALNSGDECVTVQFRVSFRLGKAACEWWEDEGRRNGIQQSDKKKKHLLNASLSLSQRCIHRMRKHTQTLYKPNVLFVLGHTCLLFLEWENLSKDVAFLREMIDIKPLIYLLNFFHKNTSDPA